MAKTQFSGDTFGRNASTNGLLLTVSDIEGFKSFFDIGGFRFIRRHSDTFYFTGDFRSQAEVIEKLNNIKHLLKDLCFARFCGTFVIREEITSPNDFVISIAVCKDDRRSGPSMVVQENNMPES